MSEHANYYRVKAVYLERQLAQMTAERDELRNQYDIISGNTLIIVQKEGRLTAELQATKRQLEEAIPFEQWDKLSDDYLKTNNSLTLELQAAREEIESLKEYELAINKLKDERGLCESCSPVSAVDDVMQELVMWIDNVAVRNKEIERLKELEQVDKQATVFLYDVIETLKAKLQSCKEQLSRYESATSVEGVVHDRRFFKNDKLRGVLSVEVPKELIGKRVKVLVMPEDSI